MSDHRKTVVKVAPWALVVIIAIGCADRDLRPAMVVVPAGSFMMGSLASEEGRDPDEEPQHRVTIGSPFAVGVYEVSFAEWNACVAAGGCRGYRPDGGWGRGSHPVINVSWDDAQAYVQWLSRETGERYRLLTEAEWEYVARAGTATAWYWGGREGQCRYANGSHLFARCTDRYENTAPVGSFQRNAFGLYDVSGNVYEWTEDCWNDHYWDSPIDGGARDTGDCSQRVMRGGSWASDPWALRSANRDRFPVGMRDNNNGFRVAKTIN